MPTESPTVESLVEASRRATGMIAHHASRLHEAADIAAEDLREGRRKGARAGASTLVRQLEEVDRLVDAAMRLTRAALSALDEDLTQHRAGALTAEQRSGVDRRRFDRRLADRRQGDRRESERREDLSP